MEEPDAAAAVGACAERLQAEASADRLRRVSDSLDAKKRRDRRTTRLQRKTLRLRRVSARVLEQRSSKEVEAQLAKDYIAERRAILQEHPSTIGSLGGGNGGNAAKAGGSAAAEHPSVLGYCLQPVTSKWDPRLGSPVFFGYDAQLAAEETIALLDCKLFGVDKGSWSGGLEEALLCAVHGSVAALGVHRAAVYLIGIEGLRGEALRRTREKLERRAKKSPLFQTHLANMVRQDGAAGVLNVRVGVITSGTAGALSAERNYVFKTRGPKVQADQTLLLDIPQHEARLARQVAAALTTAVSSGSLVKRLRAARGGSPPAAKISLAINFVPRMSRAGNAQDYAVQADTPRKRRSKGRQLVFQAATQMGRLAEQAKQSDDEDQEEQKEQKQCFVEPRYELAKVLHPAHFGRATRHVRPDIRKVSPIFWGAWSAPQARELDPDSSSSSRSSSCKVSAKTCNPAFFGGHTDWAPTSAVLHHARAAKARRQQQPQHQHPMFTGYVPCLPDYNQLLKALEPRGKSEEEEAEEDEAFLASLRGGRGKNQSTKESKEQAEQRMMEVERRRTMERNVHPATRGYKRREVPLFAPGAAAALHPASFGYETGPEQVRPPQRISAVLHPSCVGYKLAAEQLEHVEHSAAVINPIFFGRTLDKGPRYVPPEPSNDKLAQRKALLDSLVFNPHQERVQKCHLCFGAEAQGCPMCWRPEAWELDGIKNSFEGHATKALKLVTATHSLGCGQNLGNVRLRGNQNIAAAAAPRTTVKLKFKQEAIHALKRDLGLVSPADIRAYRARDATILTVFIKSLPTGDVIRLQIESDRTVADLYFLYRTNSKTVLANQPRTHLVLPTMENLICFDPTLIAEDETSCALKPGALALKDFGLHQHQSELCMFQLADLQHPDVSGVVSTYISQNVNLARRLDIEDMEKKEVDSITRHKMRRYRATWGIGLSIKSRAGKVRSKQARIRAEQQAEQQRRALLAADDTEADAGANKPQSSPQQQALPQLNSDIFRLVRFTTKVIRPDQVRDQGQAAQDRLQVMLIREMHDLITRQQRAWADHMREREEFIQQQRRLKIQRATEKRKLATAKDEHIQAVRDKQAQRRQIRNERLNNKADAPIVPPLALVQLD